MHIIAIEIVKLSGFTSKRLFLPSYFAFTFLPVKIN